MTESVDGIVLGAGEAGTIVANLAIEAGRRVALVRTPSSRKDNKQAHASWQSGTQGRTEK